MRTRPRPTGKETSARVSSYTARMARRIVFAAWTLVAGLGGCDKDPATVAPPPTPEKAAEKAAPEAANDSPVENASPRTTPLAVGDAAPAFTLSDARGESFALADHLEQGPVVAIFYRGHW